MTKITGPSRRDTIDGHKTARPQRVSSLEGVRELLRKLSLADGLAAVLQQRLSFLVSRTPNSISWSGRVFADFAPFLAALAGRT